jgi:hypothetical protein
VNVFERIQDAYLRTWSLCLDTRADGVESFFWVFASSETTVSKTLWLSSSALVRFAASISRLDRCCRKPGLTAARNHSNGFVPNDALSIRQQ